MNFKSAIIPNLEPRFQEPEGWRWHSFKRNEREIRFGSVFPKDKVPDAVVIGLGGLSEFAEKYFEIAHWCLEHNLAFWIMDWYGQGRSGRYLDNPHKRHAVDFDEDVEDLHYFYMEYVKHACVHPDVGRIPVAMLAHSMGGNIGLRFLHKYPDIFECAAFSAPMFGVKALSVIPKPLRLLATSSLNRLAGESYAYGHAEWREDSRPAPGDDLFSTDPFRGAIHNAWCLADPELQVGHVTYGWVHHAAQSCDYIQRVKFLKSIQTHCLIGMAGDEHFVDNAAVQHGAKTLENAKLIEYPKAKHELLMEKNEIRDDFLNHFYILIKENIIERPEALKPF
tara:strand:- start:322 stop:1332 length:1011 start_codon:yes stop_codon:yes gene_type:complete